MLVHLSVQHVCVQKLGKIVTVHTKETAGNIIIHRVGPVCGCSTAISVIGNVGCIPRGSNDTDVCSDKGDCVCDMCQCHPIPLLVGRIYQVNFLKYLIIINKLIYFRVIIVSVVHLLVHAVQMKMVMY